MNRVVCEGFAKNLIYERLLLLHPRMGMSIEISILPLSWSQRLLHPYKRVGIEV